MALNTARKYGRHRSPWRIRNPSMIRGVATVLVHLKGILQKRAQFYINHRHMFCHAPYTLQNLAQTHSLSISLARALSRLLARALSQEITM